jgi:PilZ domain
LSGAGGYLCREIAMQVSEAEKSYIKQRQAPRVRENRPVWIDAGDGSPLQKCVLWDISEAGVRITIDAPSGVPFEFFLVLSKDGKVRRRCRVIWRSDDQIGACFLSAPNCSLPT